MPEAFDELRLSPAGGELLVGVRVSPGARREALLGLYGEVLKVAVRAPPERGRANEAVLDVVARALALPRAALRVVAGQKSRDKTLAISGVDAPTVRARLAETMSKARR